MNKKIKLYTYITFGTIFIAIIIPVVVIGLIVLSIFLPEFLILTIPAILCLIGAYIAMIIRGEVTPKILSTKGVEYRGKSIDWPNVKITAFPLLHSSFCYGYCLVFDDKYLFGKELVKQYRKGFCVYAKKKPLELILQYCQNKILVLDVKLENEVLPNATKKINAIINNFNNQF